MWQPMETSPRDGTSIIAAIAVYSCAGRFLGWQIDVIYCHDETGEIHSECERGWEWDDYEVWQPCPEPPSDVPAHYSQKEAVDRAELRRLAEAARDYEDSAWDIEPSVLLDGYTAVTDGGTVTVCHCFREERAAFIAAASPDAVLGLLDEIERLREVFVAERDQHVAHNRAMISQREAERETLMKIAEGFKAERDQLRAVAVRLKGALTDIGHNQSCAFWRYTIGAASKCDCGYRETLADPEVEKL